MFLFIFSFPSIETVAILRRLIRSPSSIFLQPVRVRGVHLPNPEAIHQYTRIDFTNVSHTSPRDPTLTYGCNAAAISVKRRGRRYHACHYTSLARKAPPNDSRNTCPQITYLPSERPQYSMDGPCRMSPTPTSSLHVC